MNEVSNDYRLGLNLNSKHQNVRRSCVLQPQQSVRRMNFTDLEKSESMSSDGEQVCSERNVAVTVRIIDCPSTKWR